MHRIRKIILQYANDRYGFDFRQAARAQQELHANGFNVSHGAIIYHLAVYRNAFAYLHGIDREKFEAQVRKRYSHTRAIADLKRDGIEQWDDLVCVQSHVMVSSLPSTDHSA